ncbi:MAG: tautomerase family protein [Roseiarcus sp.]|jgi:phenylpyruvate tautomerase PptA (4-oxalocrotonate tautomerase family)
MPLTRVSMLSGKPPGWRRAILDSLYLAMRETFNVPEDDRFMTITEHERDDFVYGADYLGIARSDDLVMIQITVSNTRGVAQKQALFARIAERLAQSPGLRKEDVLINLVETLPENWSFGSGLAQYVEKSG